MQRRWKVVTENVNLMLFRDRKYERDDERSAKKVIMSAKQEHDTTNKTKMTTKSKKRKRTEETKEQEQNEDNNNHSQQSQRTETKQKDMVPDPFFATYRYADKKKTVYVSFFKELDVTQWKSTLRFCQEQHVDDVILITVQMQSNVQTTIERFLFDDRKSETLRVECFETSSLMNDLLSHRANQQNRPILLSPGESTYVHHTLLKDAELPVLRMTDVVAQWLGARPNQLMQIDRVSRGVGTSRAYRVVQR